MCGRVAVALIGLLAAGCANAGDDRPGTQSAEQSARDTAPGRPGVDSIPARADTTQAWSSSKLSARLRLALAQRQDTAGPTEFEVLFRTVTPPPDRESVDSIGGSGLRVRSLAGTIATAFATREALRRLAEAREIVAIDLSVNVDATRR